MSREYPEFPRVGVGAVVWRGEEVLLIRRAQPPRAGQWSIPGGGLELGETVSEAAMREVFEETGVEISVSGVVTVVDLIERDPDGRVLYHYVLVDVCADWVAGEPQAATDALEVCWQQPARLDTLDIWSETRRIIDLAAQQRAAKAGS